MLQKQSKPKIEIVAVHPAYGEVTFSIPAQDAREAFSLFKQIVFSCRQWSVRKNGGGESKSTVSETEDETLDGVDNI